jgi:hypothetical protein
MSWLPRSKSTTQKFLQAQPSATFSHFGGLN